MSQSQSQPRGKRFRFWKGRACIAENMAWGKRACAWERRLEDACADEVRGESLETRRPRTLQVVVETELRRAAKRDARARRVRERLACEAATLAARRRVGKALLAELKDRVSSCARTSPAEPRRELPNDSLAVSRDVARSGARRRTLESFMNRRAGGQPTQCGSHASRRSASIGNLLVSFCCLWLCVRPLDETAGAALGQPTRKEFETIAERRAAATNDPRSTFRQGVGAGGRGEDEPANVVSDALPPRAHAVLVKSCFLAWREVSATLRAQRQAAFLIAVWQEGSARLRVRMRSAGLACCKEARRVGGRRMHFACLSPGCGVRGHEQRARARDFPGLTPLRVTRRRLLPAVVAGRVRPAFARGTLASWTAGANLVRGGGSVCSWLWSPASAVLLSSVLGRRCCSAARIMVARGT